MSQVLMSLDQCRLHKETKDLTIEQHIRALWGITMDETGVPDSAHRRSPQQHAG
jgi:hypothetical protein